MKHLLGSINANKYNSSDINKNTAAEPSAVKKSVVTVNFPERHVSYPYYNDSFNVYEGAIVYVSGKLSGETGIIESISYKFKIDLNYYEKVIAMPDLSFTGKFTNTCGMMICTGKTSLTPELFRTWITPPQTSVPCLMPIDGGGFTFTEQAVPADFVCGEGYEVTLSHFEDDDEVKEIIYNRGTDYAEHGRVRYLSLNDGEGTAFVRGCEWYEVNFRYADGEITELYCSCPYPGFCKHSAAVLYLLRNLLKKSAVNENNGFTAVEKSYFWFLLEHKSPEIEI